MKAAVLTSIPGELSVEDVAIDKPQKNEVLIRTAAAGLCHSDLHFMEGKYPYLDARRSRARVAPASSRRSARTSPTCSPATT